MLARCLALGLLLKPQASLQAFHPFFSNVDPEHLLAKTVVARGHTAPLFLFFFKQINHLLDARFDVIADLNDMARRSQSTARSIASEMSDCLDNLVLFYHVGNLWF